MHLDNNGACKRYWSPQRKMDGPESNDVQQYDDERIKKVHDSLTVTHLISLARHLHASALDFEFQEYSYPVLH